MSYEREPTRELWAVLDATGAVLRSRGGSSTRARLMVYDSEAKAEGALKGPWIKLVIPDRSVVQVVCVYRADSPKQENTNAKP